MGSLISIVIPVYNVKKYLSKCIDSVISQTYSNIEIILVDDGSNDGCSEMCDKYKKNDNRVIVIHKENGGLSDARNVGIKIARGEYITFIDSDDFIEKNYIEYLYSLINENNSDLAICEYKYITEKNQILNKFDDNGCVNVFSRKEALIELCNEKMFSNSAWGKLYLTKCFCDIEYPKGKLFEDIPTTYKLFAKCNSIVFGKKALYNYLYRNDAISKQKFSLNRLDSITFVEEMTNYINEQYPDSISICKKRKFVEYVYVYKSLCLDKDFDRRISRKIYKKMINVNDGIFSLLSKKMKIYSISVKFGEIFLYIWTKIENMVSKWRMYKKENI